MKGVARSFWLLVTLVVAVEVFVLVLCLRSTHLDLSCWLPGLTNSSHSYAGCGRSIALVGSHNWVPAAVILSLFLTTLLAGAGTFIYQLVRTRSLLNRLGGNASKPDRVAALEEMLNISVSVKDNDLCFGCTAGLVHPNVIISTKLLGMLDDAELAAVLAHEASHVSRRDPARKLAVICATNALLYVPLIRHLAGRTRVAVELGADAYAVEKAGRTAVVNALLKMFGEVRPALGTTTEMASLDSLDIRIEALRTSEVPRARSRRRTNVLSAGAVTLLVLLGLWLPAPVSSIAVSHIHVIVHGSSETHSRSTQSTTSTTL